MANHKIKHYYFKDIAWKEVKFYDVHFMWKEFPRTFAVALKFYNSSKTCRQKHSCENLGTS